MAKEVKYAQEEDCLHIYVCMCVGTPPNTEQISFAQSFISSIGEKPFMQYMSLFGQRPNSEGVHRPDAEDVFRHLERR